MQKNLPLSLKDYSKIFNSIFPLLTELRGQFDIGGCCVPINYFAYNILKNNFNHLNPYYGVGNVLYNIDDHMVSYYDRRNNKKNNWHTFIILQHKKESFYIDFMAPIFHQVFSKKIDLAYKIQPKMFQKPTVSGFDFSTFFENVLLGKSKSGDFSFIIDEQVRGGIVDSIQKNIAIQDCAQLALALFNSKDNYIYMQTVQKNKEKITIMEKSNIKIDNYW